MISETYKKRAHLLIKTAKKNGMITNYSDFCKTKLANDTQLNEEEISYYTNKNKYNKDYNIGDIVFVLNYVYKNGEKGANHFFVIIDEDQAIDFNYFGFLLSSNINKVKFPYNELIEKNLTNGLYKDSIVKCDDFIRLSSKDISFKIGNVSEEDLTRFLDTYEKYLANN